MLQELVRTAHEGRNKVIKPVVVRARRRAWVIARNGEALSMACNYNSSLSIRGLNPLDIFLAKYFRVRVKEYARVFQLNMFSVSAQEIRPIRQLFLKFYGSDYMVFPGFLRYTGGGVGGPGRRRGGAYDPPAVSGPG